MSEVGIRLAGLGGQGIVLTSVILGRAASVYDHLYAVQTQTYGSDMRGGDVCTELILSEKKIIYPIVNTPDILVAIAQKAYEQYIGDLKGGGILVTDTDLVKVNDLPETVRHYHKSFNRKAIDDCKDKRVANMILLGFISKTTNMISFSSLEKAINDLLPPKAHALNIKALNMGAELALSSE